MPDVYVNMDFQLVRRIDKAAIKFHATRDHMVRYCMQIALPILDSMSPEDRHTLMRKFENNEALDKAPADTSEF